MKKPVITVFGPSIEADSHIVCFLAKSLTQGYYRKGGFLILPYPVTTPRYNVFFPDLSYSSSFWRVINKTPNIDYGYAFPEKAGQEVQHLLEEYDFVQKTTLRTKDIKKKWLHYEDNFIDKLISVFKWDKILSGINTIDIQLTPYGTPGSYYVFKKNGQTRIKCTSRLDQNPALIARTLMLAFYTLVSNQSAEIGEIHWFEKQAFVDFVFKQTIIADIFPRAIFNINNPPELSIYLKDSQRYMNKLRLARKVSLRIDNDMVVYNNIIIDTLFSAAEKKLIRFLITHGNSVVSFEDAAYAIWQDQTDEKYSLYALAKIIENIRSKLYAAGIYSDPIKTIRKHGYLLLQ